jgi:hypothetical protein
MYVVAGPSGSGKTSAFPGSQFGCDYFNADDYAAFGVSPKLIASLLGREITFLASDLPAWMDEALGQTSYSTVKLRQFFEQRKPLPVA